MKKIWIAMLLLASFATVCLATDKVEAPDACKHCGMNRTKFAHSRMIITYTDGSSTGTCSINCAVTDLKESKKEIRSLQVADYNTKKLINAKTATWVVGGSIKGVMTMVPKWAFAEKSDAEAFIIANGGEIATFNELFKAAERDEADRSKRMKPREHKGHGGHTM